VFVPIGFIPGITGALYRQFAVAVSAAVIISAINALTLSPALCALLLRPGGRRGVMGWALGVIDRIQTGYAGAVRGTVRFATLSLLAVAIAAGAAFFLFGLIPTGFLPEEDQGFFYAEIDLPPGASVNRTDALASQVEKIIRAEESVAALTSIIGFSQLNSVALSNAAFLVVRLAPFEQRTDPSQSVNALIAKIKAETAGVSGASILLYNAPPIIGLGSTGGFQYELESIGGGSPGRSRGDHAGARLRGQSAAGARERIQHLCRQLAPGLSRYRSQQGADPGRRGQRHLPGPAGDNGQLLHQSVQRLWSSLAGQRPG
jgi:HAE1 family hydrophobic/amphiphilic exporter-1